MEKKKKQLGEILLSGVRAEADVGRRDQQVPKLECSGSVWSIAFESAWNQRSSERCVGDDSCKD